MKAFPLYISMIFWSLNVFTQQNGSSIHTQNHRNEFVKKAALGDTFALDNYLALGMPINTTDYSGRTAILAATEENNVTLVKWLIKKGADIDYFDPSKKPIDYTPFLYAGAYGLDEILDVLIPLKPDVNLLNGYGGNALIPACEKGHPSTVKKLLEETAVDIDLVNNLGWTALLETIALNDGGEIYLKIVQLLLLHHADINIADKHGVTPIEHARKKGFDEIVELLRIAQRQ